MFRLFPLLTFFVVILWPGQLFATSRVQIEDVGTSVRIPSVGQTVTYTLRVRAAANEPLQGLFKASLQIDGQIVAQKTLPLQLTAEQIAEIPLSWRPTQDGWHRLQFSLQAVNGAGPVAQILRLVPVTARPLYFVWFGAPLAFKWANVPTTVKEADQDKWLWRGAIPCAWRGGVCYKEWPQEKFLEHYRSSPWIAIDEVGGLDDAGQKIMAAVRAHKQAHPHGFRLIWFMGVHDFWRQYRDCIDLFVPEVYLNYRGNHLGHIEAYVRRVRAVGCADRTVLGLGINIIEDENKQPRVIPTKEDVLRQIRYIKALAPELPGVGFFTSYSAAPGVAEYADELCQEYFIQPVLTLVPDSLQIRRQGQMLLWQATVSNNGGMTARHIGVEFGWGYGEAFRSLGQKIIPALAPLQKAVISGQVPAPAGLQVLSIRLVPPKGCSLLNKELYTMAASLSLARQPVFWQPVLAELPSAPSAPDLPLFARVPASFQAKRAEMLQNNGAAMSSHAVAILPGLPDESDRIATWLASPRQLRLPRAFRLTNQVPVAPSSLQWQRAEDGLHIATGFYQAHLHLAKDQIVSLRTSDHGPELLGSPWSFSCTAYTGFQPATLAETPGGLLVTIPFANAEAEGFSRYFFYTGAPVIRIERWLAPRQELIITNSVEGCHMPQRGGIYALQPGVGGPVGRGQLQDSSAYRDLLFGYLGAAPSPENARKAGWLETSFRSDGGGGLGVVIERRWEAAYSSVGYDVTRYYDGADRIEVRNLWGEKIAIQKPQGQIVYLLPHGPMPLEEPHIVPPAQWLWHCLQQYARKIE